MTAAPLISGPHWGPRAGGPPRQLVVLCHGLGADGHDLIDLAPQWAAALPDAVFVAPDAPEPFAGAPFGRQWFEIGQREAGVPRARVALDRFLDAELAARGLPGDAYALMGFSQGAMTALYTGLRRAVPPRVILSYSGALIDPASLDAQMTRPPPPVLLVHGQVDPVVPIAASQEAERQLRAAGVAVETLWCANLPHGIDAAGLTAGALALQRAFAPGG